MREREDERGQPAMRDWRCEDAYRNILVTGKKTRLLARMENLEGTERELWMCRRSFSVISPSLSGSLANNT